MLDSNPTLVQTAPGNRSHAKPLVLIHDGGGTIFAYYSLGRLNRDVYAISNPSFNNGKVWEGGIHEMATTYIRLLDKAGLQGPIYLGGWSLGALISIEMAHILATQATTQLGRNSTKSQSKISILGLLMLDISMHIPWSMQPPVAPFQLPDTVPEGVRRCMDQTKDLLQDWRLPSWQNPSVTEAQQQSQRIVYVGFARRPIVIPPGHVYYQPRSGPAIVKPLDGIHDAPSYLIEGISKCEKPQKAPDRELASEPEAETITPIGPPPAILIRCTESTPVPSSGSVKSESETTPPSVRVDLLRQSISLGWQHHQPEFISAVIDVASNHYNMFEFEKVDILTSKIIEAMKLCGG